MWAGGKWELKLENSQTFPWKLMQKYCSELEVSLGCTVESSTQENIKQTNQQTESSKRGSEKSTKKVYIRKSEASKPGQGKINALPFLWGSGKYGLFHKASSFATSTR